jgi:hypothetical protein
MQFHCLIYFDPRIVFADTAEAHALLASVPDTLAELEASGRLIMQLPLNLPQTAETVSVREGETVITDGPFTEAKEMLGGIALIEARDRAEAMKIAATLPHATLGYVEVRPAIDFTQPRPSF